MHDRSSAPEITVIIPVYNRPATVLEAIESVFAQRVEDCEVLLIDDGSDPPLALPEHLVGDLRLRILRHPENRGAAAARNTGMRAARGTWIAFLDSDDQWVPRTLAPRLESARRTVAADADAAVVFVAGFRYTPVPGRQPDVRIPLPAHNLLDFASGCWFSPGSTALFLRERILSEVGLQEEGLRRFEDVDWFLRLGLAGGKIVVHPIVATQLGRPSKLPAATVEQQGQLVLQKFLSFSPEQLGRRIRRRLRAWLAFEVASACWHEKRYWNMLVNLVRSWCLAPRLTLYLRSFWHRQSAT